MRIEIPDFSAINAVAKDVERFVAFGRQVAQIHQEFQNSLVNIDRSLLSHFQEFYDDQLKLRKGLQRHEDAHILISAELPKRGWYLSGQEPCSLTLDLANAIRSREWDRVDQMLLDQLPVFHTDSLSKWLTEEGVPQFCVNRVLLFLKHHQEGNYEVSTYLGVPLLDEVAKFFFEGKDFTTKGGGKKPQIAIKTVRGPNLQEYAEAFLRFFGSLQEDSDSRRFADENYWNRSAILHGLMKRPMGLKDSAKCLMALSFLFFARKEESKAA